MLIIGLTGSIAMGKSAAAEYIGRKGLPVWSADEAVHRLYEGKAAHLIEAAFPGSLRGGVVDRARLSAILQQEEGSFARLEAIIHPLVERERAGFIRQQEQAEAEMILLDIPLLFEKGLESEMDVVLLVTAPPHIQRQRAMARPGMSEAKLEMILANQMSDAQKRLLADHVIDTSGPFEQTHKQIDQILKSLQ